MVYGEGVYLTMGRDVGLTPTRKEDRLISTRLTFKSYQFLHHYFQAHSFVGNGRWKGLVRISVINQSFITLYNHVKI